MFSWGSTSFVGVPVGDGFYQIISTTTLSYASCIGRMLRGWLILFLGSYLYGVYLDILAVQAVVVETQLDGNMLLVVQGLAIFGVIFAKEVVVEDARDANEGLDVDGFAVEDVVDVSALVVQEACELGDGQSGIGEYLFDYFSDMEVAFVIHGGRVFDGVMDVW